MAVTRTDRIGLEIAPYEEPRIDLIHTRNWEKLDELQCICPALAETLSSTVPVDVFIYDTTKDSDGGAWRDRCEALSWYQETLNTSTRGATRKFPAVVVIVAETDKVTIFDLTDPSVPMWMVFNSNININLLRTNTTSVYMLNGVLTAGHGASQGINEIFFIKDTGGFITVAGFGTYTYNGLISERNDGNAFTQSDISRAIVNGYPNNVAMIIIDNAPIDPETLITIPTIAAPTDAGGSWVKDDNTVVDVTGAIILIDSDIIPSGFTVWAAADKLYIFHSIPSVDTALTSADYIFDTAGTSGPHISGIISSVEINGTDIYVGTDEGLFVISYDSATPANSTVNQTTNVFTSGIMQGDIQLALSGEDLTDKSVQATAVVDNGGATFAPVATGAELEYTTAVGGTITTTVPTGDICYGWELISGEWIFRNDISEWVGISESGGVLNIADGTSFTLLAYTTGTPTTEQLTEIETLENELFKTNALSTLQGTSSDVNSLGHNSDTDELLVGTGSGATRFNGIVAYQEELNITESDGTITTTTDDDYTSIAAALHYVLHGVTTGSFANSEQSNVQERMIELEQGKLDKLVADALLVLKRDLTNLIFGDEGAGNYTEIEEDGTMKANGDATCWDDLQVVLTGAELHPTQSPVWIDYKGSRALQFSSGSAQTIYFIAQIPHNWVEGSDIEFHVHAIHQATATGSVIWDFTHSWANVTGTFPTETTVQKSFATHSGVDIHAVGDIATLDGTGKTISSIMLCSLTRRGDIDTSAENSVLIGADFHHLINTLGSKEEYVK